MKKFATIKTIIMFFLFFTCFTVNADNGEKEGYFPGDFVRPGMAQSKADLEYMRTQVLKGEEPWETAFQNLKKEVSEPLRFEPYTYISVGAYNANSVGGKDFSNSARASYNYSLMWYITGEKEYARKSIDILNSWSYRLWGFDANNAKLNVGLFGHYFLNAAEILRHTDSGWQEKDVEQFKRMLLTVFYPTIKDFFTEANGNWDASMINTMMCIAVFVEDKEMFNRAVERYYRGEGNSGITKYIYQGGQCQEATRDWGHVQLGLGEFAKAAQVAWTQGLDFYSVADNRLASGYEQAAKFLLGNEIDIFGALSFREMEDIADIYESINYHYMNVKNMELPYTKSIIEKRTRSKSSVGFLTAARNAEKKGKKETIFSAEQKIKPDQTGALKKNTVAFPPDAVFVDPGNSVQEALDKHKGQNKWIVLRKGIHVIKEPLRMPGSVTLSGEGIETILFLDSKAEEIPIIMNAEKDLHDVVIRDLLIEGGKDTAPAFDPNYERSRLLYNSTGRAGIIFLADFPGQMKNIMLENITVQNFTKNAVMIAGAYNVTVNNCNLSDNGSNVVPGAGFHHNLNITRTNKSKITNSRFVSSLWGNGIFLSFCTDVEIMNNEIARNRLSGICCAESENISIANNLIEGNDKDGVEIDKLMDDCKNISVKNNIIQYNTGYGIASVIPENVRKENNKQQGNGL